MSLKSFDQFIGQLKKINSKITVDGYATNRKGAKDPLIVRCIPVTNQNTLFCILNDNGYSSLIVVRFPTVSS